MMKLIGISPESHWDKDIMMGNNGSFRDIRVDYDDVDHGEARERMAMIHVSPEMLDICLDFVLKCHLGLARSNETYGKMKAVLDVYHAQAAYEREE